MVHSLLSAVLVATQLLSWNASELYLCTSSDGSFCIDFGPESCTCCHDESLHDGCSGHDRACGTHEHAENSTDDESEPCGCDHIQISEPQAATLVRAVAAPESPHEFVPPVAIAVSHAANGCLSASTDSAHPPLNPHDAPSAALHLLASVVIQC